MKKTHMVNFKQRVTLFFVAIMLIPFGVRAQDNKKTFSKTDSIGIYPGGDFYKVKKYKVKIKAKRPKNVILMIGDGMGIAHVSAGMTANGGHLYIENFNHVGFSRTQSSNKYITDSAAGGTALSTGQKTYNGAIGVDEAKNEIPNIREIAESDGKATGIVSTSSITHATPASFVAHQPQRSMHEEIAGDFLKTDIDVFIGGGYNFFTKRKDGRNLVNELESNGYLVLTDINKISKVKKGKLAGLTAPMHNPRTAQRGDMLEVATQTALNILDNDRDGFFLMIEGSQIDWGGHANNTRYVINEMLDFDKAIAKALSFAAKDKETLIVITADHETGGLSIKSGDMNTGKVHGKYTTANHTGVVVPVFAFGPGAEEFTGFMENTDIPKRIMKLLGYK